MVGTGARNSSVSHDSAAAFNASSSSSSASLCHVSSLYRLAPIVRITAPLWCCTVKTMNITKICFVFLYLYSGLMQLYV